jgi:hypothetical protein
MTNLDPISVSIIAQAIDFLFDQGAKILQERRDKRKNVTSDQNQSVEQDKAEIILMISASINQREIEQCYKLIDNHLQNKYKLEEKIARLFISVDYAPPQVQAQLASAENELKKQVEHLHMLVQAGSKTRIFIPGLE